MLRVLAVALAAGAAALVSGPSAPPDVPAIDNIANNSKNLQAPPGSRALQNTTPVCKPCLVNGESTWSTYVPKCSPHGLKCVPVDSPAPGFTGACARDRVDACHTCGSCVTQCGNCIIPDQSKGKFEPLGNRGDCASDLSCIYYVPRGRRARLGMCVKQGDWECAQKCQDCGRGDFSGWL